MGGRRQRNVPTPIKHLNVSICRLTFWEDVAALLGGSTGEIIFVEKQAEGQECFLRILGII